MSDDEVLRAAGRLVAGGVDPAPFLAALGPAARWALAGALIDGVPLANRGDYCRACNGEGGHRGPPLFRPVDFAAAALLDPLSPAAREALMRNIPPIVYPMRSPGPADDARGIIFGPGP